MITKNADLIPIFTTQLEKAREATDAANLRAAYAECAAEVLTANTDVCKKVTTTQQTAGWTDTTLKIADVVANDDDTLKTLSKTVNTVYVSVDINGEVEFGTTAPEGATEIGVATEDDAT